MMRILSAPARIISALSGCVPALLAVALMASVVAAAPPPQPVNENLIRSGEQMLYAGRCADAINVLREQYDANPDNDRITVSLKNAYICNKDFDSARVLLERFWARSKDPGQRTALKLEIAGLQFRLGLEDEGRRQLAQVVAADRENLRTYEMAADVLMTNGFYGDAVKFLQESRTNLRQPRAFSRKLAQLYEVLRNYGDAAREYLGEIQADSTQEVFISGRMANLIRLDVQEDYDTGLGKALAEMARLSASSPDAQRFYGDYLVAQGQLEPAFQRFRAADSLANAQGRLLLHFARAARDRGDEAMIHRACAAIPSASPHYVQSLILLADSHAMMGKFDEAAQFFDEIITTSPNERDKAEAMFALGNIQLHGLHDPTLAIVTLTKFIEKFPRLPLAGVGQMLIADAELALGNPGKADTLYANINPAALPQQSQEERLFKMAELQFFLGNYSAAREAYSKAMNAHPKSKFVNDCLRRIMLISEYSGMDEATLRVYSDAVYAKFRFDFNVALAALAKLKTRQSAILPELAWLNSGEIYEEQKQYSEALAQYDSLVVQIPDGFYAPIALERQGDIYAGRLRNCEQARAMYQQVVLNHPGSLNVDDARRKLQQTEKTLCARPDKPKS